MRGATLALLAFALTACVTTSPPPGSIRTLANLEATLAAQDSATAALTEWCARHDIASPATITASPAEGSITAPDDLEESVRGVLQIENHEPLGYRHVLLSCGDVVLSDAHNWYVPERLTEAANYLLEGTDTPFGRAVGPENFTRVRVAEERGAVDQCPEDTILSHAAILHRHDGLPISVVFECYTPANLAAAPDQ